MPEILLAFLYLPALAYSGACAPDVFFRLFRFRDTPEYAAFYFIGCMFLSISLVGAAFRIHELIATKEPTK